MPDILADISANEKRAIEGINQTLLKGLAELENKLNKILEKAVEHNDIDILESQYISAYFEIGVDWAKNQSKTEPPK